MEEAPLLMAVHRIVGGIHVQHNLFGRPLEGGDEGRGQNLVNRPRPIPFGPVLEAAQRRRAGQSPVAPGRRLQGKVMAQGRVIVQILVAQRNPEYPLAQQIRHAMAQLAPLTRIAKPARHRRRQAKPAIRLTQQQRTAIARHLTAVETRLDPAPATGWKSESRPERCGAIQSPSAGRQHRGAGSTGGPRCGRDSRLERLYSRTGRPSTRNGRFC